MQAQDLLRELKRTVDELQAFNDIGKTLTSTLDVREVLRIIMQKVSELLRPANWSLLLTDDRTSELFFEIAVGEGADKIKSARLAMGEGIAGWVAREGQALLVADAHADPRFASRFEKMTGHATKSIVAVPMRSKGKILGVIELVNSGDGRAFSADDLRTLATIADYAAIAIENAKTLERLRELTLVDDHTGLYNTRHLYRQLEAEILRSRRFGHKLSVLFFDLDHFKVVNDTYGHQAGSGLLKEIGEVLLETLRTVDIPTRYGGDEFVCLLPETDRAQAVRCAQRVRQAINDRVFLQGRGLAVRITASFGIATFPDDGQTEEDLLRLADGAMYRVKESTRDAILAAEPLPAGAAPAP